MKKIFSLVTLCGILVGCNAGKNQTNIELIQDMMDQPNIKAQDWDPNKKDYLAMREPPKHTIARNRAHYKYAQDPVGADKDKNPFGGQMSPEILSKGKAKYEIYCGVCHGTNGSGNGPVAEKMAVKPPTLISDKVKKYSDGRLFSVITMGQGLMGAYATQIYDPEDRWAIVNYVRSLQKRSGN